VIFTPTRLAGAFIIDLEERHDERGFFARAWCAAELEAHGLNPAVDQCNVSHNTASGTLRGLHYQAAPHEEAKVVRCTRGRLYDVLVDLRPGSSTFGDHVGVELSAQSRRMAYVPEGFAHGFLTLEPDTEVFYMMSAGYAPESARGVRWDDPALGIDWPGPVRVISDRDRSYPDLDGPQGAR